MRHVQKTPGDFSLPFLIFPLIIFHAKHCRTELPTCPVVSIQVKSYCPACRNTEIHTHFKSYWCQCRLFWRAVSHDIWKILRCPCKKKLWRMVNFTNLKAYNNLKKKTETGKQTNITFLDPNDIKTRSSVHRLFQQLQKNYENQINHSNVQSGHTFKRWIQTNCITSCVWSLLKISHY